MKLTTFIFPILMFISFIAAADSRPNLLFIMMDDLGVGHCQFDNDDLTVEQFDPYFKELVAKRQDYTPEQALSFSKRAMPTLNKLAKDGVVFTRAYAPSSLCAASRLGVATGRSIQGNGVYANVDVENGGLIPGTHLAEVLHNAGYATAHIGKWHVGKRDNAMIDRIFEREGIKPIHDFWAIRAKYPALWDELCDAGYYGSVTKEQNPLNNGFDYYYGYNTWASQFYDSTLVWENFKHAGRQTGYNTEVFTDKALGFIQEQVTGNKPFYVQLHYHAVHDYLEPNAPDRYQKEFLSESYNLSNFYSHIYAVDQNIRRIIRLLEEKGVLDNTLIAFTSDNGAMSGGPSVLPGNAPYSGHKGMFRQGGIRVPLFFYWPQGIQTHGQLSTLVSSMDILPTFIDAAHLNVPDGLEGKSLKNIFGGDASPVRDHLYWAGIHARFWGYMNTLDLVKKGEERGRAPGGWAVAKGDYVLRYLGTIEPNLYRDLPDGCGPQLGLYNVVDDPAETTDLKDQMPELVNAMKAEYQKKIPGFKPPVCWSKEKWKELVK